MYASRDFNDKFMMRLGTSLDECITRSWSAWNRNFVENERRAKHSFVELNLKQIRKWTQRPTNSSSIWNYYFSIFSDSDFSQLLTFDTISLLEKSTTQNVADFVSKLREILNQRCVKYCTTIPRFEYCIYAAGASEFIWVWLALIIHVS